MTSKFSLLTCCLASSLALHHFIPKSEAVRILNRVPDTTAAQPLQQSEKLHLVSSGGESFFVEKNLSFESPTIKSIVEQDEYIGQAQAIHFPNISSVTLAKVLKYVKKHAEVAALGAAGTEDHIKAWDDEFVKVDRPMLFNLILASNYLNITGLLDLTTQTVARMMTGKTPEEIRDLFDIKELCDSEDGLVDNRHWSA